MNLPTRLKSRSRSHLLTALFASFLALLGNSVAHAQTPTEFNSHEQQAIKVVQGWMEAWRSKDPNKIAAFMTEDVQFRPGGMFEKPVFLIGRQAFLDYYAKELNILDFVEASVIYAVGDKGQSMILIKRVDHWTRGGQKGTTEFAGYYRVRNGKIALWEDAPTVQLTFP